MIFLFILIQKDQIFDKFIETGDLNSIGFEKVEIKKTKWDLYISLTWIALILPISIIYLIKALWFGSIYLKLAVLMLICSS